MLQTGARDRRQSESARRGTAGTLSHSSSSRKTDAVAPPELPRPCPDELMDDSAGVRSDECRPTMVNSPSGTVRSVCDGGGGGGGRPDDVLVFVLDDDEFGFSIHTSQSQARSQSTNQ